MGLQETKRIAFVEQMFAQEILANSAILQPVGAVISTVVATEERIWSNKHVKLAFLGLNKHVSRRLVAKGDENTLFSVSAVNEENQASAGWGQQNTLIPPHLQDRLTEMNAKHATQPHAVRQQAANQRRPNSPLELLSTLHHCAHTL